MSKITLMCHKLTDSFWMLLSFLLPIFPSTLDFICSPYPMCLSFYILKKKWLSFTEKAKKNWMALLSAITYFIPSGPSRLSNTFHFPPALDTALKDFSLSLGFLTSLHSLWAFCSNDTVSPWRVLSLPLVIYPPLIYPMYLHRICNCHDAPWMAIWLV